jgi:LysM repeat protein
VKEGETLSELAERYDTTVQLLLQRNRIGSPSELQAGSQLLIPGNRPTTSSGPSSSGTASRAATSKPAAPAYNSKDREHVVQAGESLSQIAELTVTPVVQTVFAVAVNNALYDAMFAKQGLGAKFSSTGTRRESRVLFSTHITVHMRFVTCDSLHPEDTRMGPVESPVSGRAAACCNRRDTANSGFVRATATTQEDVWKNWETVGSAGVSAFHFDALKSIVYPLMRTFPA